MRKSSGPKTGPCHCMEMSKYGVISGPCFLAFALNTKIYGVNLVFRPNTGKYGLEITPCLDSFHAVCMLHIDD